MPRITVAAWIVMATLAVSAAESPEVSLSRGLESFRAGDPASAAAQLAQAVQGFLSTGPMERYIATGHYDRLRELETALVYLALVHFRTGNEEEAKAAILRLIAAERIDSAYATLPLGRDAADFEAVANALLPDHGLPPNEHATADDPSRPLPRVQAADGQRALTTAQRRQISVSLAMPEQTAASPPARLLEPQPVIAPYGTSAARTAPPPPAPARDRLAPPRPAPAMPGEIGREALQSLRRARDLAVRGEIGRAAELYTSVAETPGAPREAVVEAASGLYRVSAWPEAVQAFARLGPFARGEEDLRYYFAVSLYESGAYREAQKELSCALPYLEITDDVVRYRLKIEQTVAVMARK